MRKITLEDHFSTPEMSYRLQRRFAPDFAKDLDARLLDIEQWRLPEMDQYGVDIQVLSFTSPGIQGIADADTAIKTARMLNEKLADLIRAHPTRFAGFAALPMQDPKEAANELERSVTQLGFKGALINGHTNGEYLDEQKFWVVFERAEALGVPIYLHPIDTPSDQMKPYGGYNELFGATWNWGVETATHALRLVFGGVFDAFPNLTLILGHLGEMLPYALHRLDDRWKVGTHTRKLKKEFPSQYIKDKMFITTSGNFSDAALLCALLTLGAERILFSIDYPYQRTADGALFIDAAPISDADKAKICYKNAAQLLKLEL
jgi:2,3-dihydroxybenzoate decarboxylase